MDCDTSITSITTARLRGMRTSCVGPAIATVSNTSAITSRIAGRCRRCVGPFGRHAFQQFHVGEPQHPPVPGKLHDDVERDHAEHDQQEQEEPSVLEPRQRYRSK